jgi:hypothetical protein
MILGYFTIGCAISRARKLVRMARGCDVLSETPSRNCVQTTIQLIDQWNPSWYFNSGDVCVRDAIEILGQSPQAIAVTNDQNCLTAP